jgi:hypothetical protein
LINVVEAGTPRYRDLDDTKAIRRIEVGILSTDVILAELEKQRVRLSDIRWVVSPSENLTKVAGKISERLGLVGPSPESAELGIDKAALREFCRQKALGGLRSWSADPGQRSSSEREQWESDLRQNSSGELIVKPRRGRGGFQKQPWHYQVFQNAEQLLRSEIWPQMLAIGEWHIEEYRSSAARPAWDVHVDFGITDYEIFLIAQTWCSARDPRIVISEGPVKMPDEIMECVEDHVREIWRLGYRRHLGNLQFVETGYAKPSATEAGHGGGFGFGPLHLMDFNTRMAGVLAFLEEGMCPDLDRRAIEMNVLGKRRRPLNWRFTHYRKGPFPVLAGRKLKSAHWPKFDDERREQFLVKYEENLRIGKCTPPVIHSLQPMPQVAALGSGIDEVRSRLDEFWRDCLFEYE